MPPVSVVNGRYAVRAHSTFGRGRVSFSRERLFAPVRRVSVKARIARHTGRAFRSAPLATHLAYVKRDGVTRDGQPARMFDATGDQADEIGFEARGKGDRHHFRFIVSPEGCRRHGGPQGLHPRPDAAEGGRSIARRSG
ncbi:Conserved protein of unknown function (Fragment) [Bradyrhizobium sp. ORS 285]